MYFKKQIIFLFLLVFSTSALAAGSEEKDWTKVMNAIIQVESGGDLNARSGNSVGPMQITPILVKECNAILKAKKSSVRYTLADRTNLEKSKEMFILIQEKYNKNNNEEFAIRSWNQGPRYSMKVTQRYYNKVLAAMNK